MYLIFFIKQNVEKKLMHHVFEPFQKAKNIFLQVSKRRKKKSEQNIFDFEEKNRVCNL